MAIKSVGHCVKVGWVHGERIHSLSGWSRRRRLWVEDEDEDEEEFIDPAQAGQTWALV